MGREFNNRPAQSIAGRPSLYMCQAFQPAVGVLGDLQKGGNTKMPNGGTSPMPKPTPKYQKTSQTSHDLIHKMPNAKIPQIPQMPKKIHGQKTTASRKFQARYDTNAAIPEKSQTRYVTKIPNAKCQNTKIPMALKTHLQPIPIQFRGIASPLGIGLQVKVLAALRRRR